MTMNNFQQMQKIIHDQIMNSVKTAEKIAGSEEIIDVIKDAAKAIIATIENKGKVMIAGNGGSAADSQHIAAEFVNRFYFDRPGLPAIALTTDTSVLTAIGNDYGFDRAFARQLNAIGTRGDIFLALSTSGNSVNIIEALRECRSKGIRSIGFTGSSGGKMNDLCDIIIKVPSDETPRIQEMHILIAHIICAITEDTLFQKPDSGR
jgi:D-sedoheptulose 7-phosphate isomerase